MENIDRKEKRDNLIKEVTELKEELHRVQQYKGIPFHFMVDDIILRQKYLPLTTMETLNIYIERLTMDIIFKEIELSTKYGYYVY